MSATTAKIAAAVAGGYLLGRTKKLKLAITMAGLLAGKKLAADPKAIANRIVDSNPELEHLRGQLTEGLTGAAKELALSTAAARMESMTSALQGTAEDVKRSGQETASQAAGGAGKAGGAAAKATGSSRGTSSGPPRKSTAKKAPKEKPSGKRSGSASGTKKSTAEKSSSSPSRG